MDLNVSQLCCRVNDLSYLILIFEFWSAAPHSSLSCSSIFFTLVLSAEFEFNLNKCMIAFAQWGDTFKV